MRLQEFAKIAMQMNDKGKGNEVEIAIIEGMVDSVINRHGVDADEDMDRLHVD